MLAQFRTNNTLMKQIYDKTMEPLCTNFHITRMELDILLFLANNPGYDTAADIIELKRFTKSHVSSSIRLLEERKFLEKTFQNGNRKTIHLKLLPSSEPVVAAGQEAQRNVFTRIFSGLTPEEIQVLKTATEKISKNIRNALKEV